ncbi:hypothetical protein [Lysobacter gummosus]|uniref:hypothetical protein n=1 Tax=Lysobacter gummosus TaxID=262324 RepID=UPI00363D48B4
MLAHAARLDRRLLAAGGGRRWRLHRGGGIGGPVAAHGPNSTRTGRPAGKSVALASVSSTSAR